MTDENRAHGHNVAIEDVYRRIGKLLQACETISPYMPPTQLYNEGWMLRLVVAWFASLEIEIDQHKLAVPTGSKWYSEALLPSAFLPESRGDSRAEAWTHADGVIGHFNIGRGAKGDLTLFKGATHFVVLEAKMFSRLSSGVKNASYYNQAARNVACIAEVLHRAGRSASEFRALGFYVLAPAFQIRQGIFEEQLRKESISKLVERRVRQYEGKRGVWFSDWFLTTLERLDIRAISWEDILSFLAEHDPSSVGLQAFYERCLAFNSPLVEKSNG